MALQYKVVAKQAAAEDEGPWDEIVYTEHRYIYFVRQVVGVAP